MAFDPSTASLDEKPSKGGFDPSTATLEVDAPMSAGAESFVRSIEPLGKLDEPKKGPEVSQMGTFNRALAEGAGTIPTMLAGAGAGAELGAKTKVPYAAPVGGLVGGIVGGMLGHLGITSLEQVSDSVFGTKIMETKAAQQKAFPWTEKIGSVVGTGVGPGMALGLPKTVGAAAAGGGIMAGIGAGMRAVEGQDVLSPGDIALDVASGVFMNPTALGEKMVGKGKAIVEAAFRNKTTGKVETSGDKHDPEKKADPNLEQGFVTQEGEFLTRMEAAKIAKEAEQAKEVAKVDESLPTSDLKGEEGTPKTIVTREDHKARIGEIDSVLMDIEANPKDPRLQAEKPLALQKEREALMQQMPKVEIDNKEKPAWEEVHDVLWGAKTVGEGFQRMRDYDLGTAPQKMLMNLLDKSNLIREAKLGFSKEHILTKDARGKDILGAGQYDQTSHTVTMAKDGDVRVFLHEGIHAATFRLLADQESHLAQKMNSLYEMVKNAKDAKFAEEYGFTDLHEFVSEAFTNRRFQSILMAMDATGAFPVKTLSMWDKFKEFVKDSLVAKLRKQATTEEQHEALSQMKNRSASAFDEAMDLGGKLIYESRKHTFDPDAGVVSKPAASKYEREDAQEYVKRHSSLTGSKKELFVDWLHGSGEILDPKKIDALERSFIADVGMDAAHSPDRIQWVADDKALLDSKGSGPVAASKILPEEVKKAAKGIDVRSIANEAEFLKHAEGIYASEGEAAALKFFRDWKEHQAKAAIPVPKNKDGLVDTLHKMDTWSTADSSEFRVKHEESTKAGVTKEQREELFRAREGEIPLTPEMKVLEERLLKEGDGEVKALIEKARKLTGDERALREFETGQARYRIFGKNERSWKDFWDTKNNPMQDKVAEEATATRERSIFQIEGTDRVVQIVHKDGLDLAYEWKNGKRDRAAIARAEKISAGDTVIVGGKSVKITDGQVHNIEAHTPYRYLKDAEATQYMKLIELRKMTRDMELIENLKGSEFFGTGRSPETPLGKIPDGYKVPNNIDKIPQLRGWMFDPKTAAIIEDFAKVWDNTLMTKLSGMLIKNMMLNPFPHMMNEVAHLWNLRGLSGWITPKGVVSLTQTGKEAFMSVSKQDAFYREVMREGGASLGADPRNNDYFNQIGKDAAKELLEKPQLQGTLEKLNDKMKSLGMGTIDLYNAWSINSQKAMWFTRDVMYVQAIKEAMRINEKRGTPLTVKQAIDRVDQHMPNYRMPTEVLGSRGLSKMLQNPNIAIFSRYHYGMLKSIANFASELNPKNLKTAEGRQEFKDGVDSLLAAGVAMTIVYPLIDVVVEKIFGEGSKLRRAGGFHVVHSALDIAAGKKDPSSMLWPIFTLNPALLALSQLVANKKLFDGKPIYHADDPAKDIASDVGLYAAKTVPQVSTGLKAEGEGSPRSAIARQFDVQTTTPEKEARISKWEKQKERQKRLRQRKREQGTYKP